MPQYRLISVPPRDNLLHCYFKLINIFHGLIFNIFVLKFTVYGECVFLLALSHNHGWRDKDQIDDTVWELR